MSDQELEQKQKMLDDMNVNLELTVRGVNVLLAMLDRPQQIPTSMAAEMMNLIQTQVVPQVEKMKSGIDAALKASKEADNG